jgi:hypothetical protein
MEQSVLQDFISRLPEGADVAVAGKDQAFFFEGQILAQDETHIEISDGESVQLVAISEIGHINYALPDTPVVIVA